MNRIPVGRSIAHAYGFLFGRIVTVITLSWVAALFFAGLRYGLFQMGPIAQPVSDHLATAGVHLAGLAGALVLISIVALPLTREALGMRGRWTLAHFSFGAPELSLFLALVRLYLILVAAIAVAVTAVVGAGIGLKLALAQWPTIGSSPVPVALLTSVAASVIVSIAVLYVGLRLSFFLYPVAAAEEHASLKAAWALGKGNVLRILLVTLAIVIPVYVVVLGCEYALMGQGFLDALESMARGNASETDALVALFLAHAGAISAGAAVLMVVMVSLSAGASAAAYRAVKGLDAHAAPADEDGHDHGHDMQVAAAHGDHGHDDHGHGGHEDHAAPEDHGHAADDGHDAHGHEAHGHEVHGHDAHGHDADGRDAHGHDADGDGALAQPASAHDVGAIEDHAHDDQAHVEAAHEPHGEDSDAHEEHGGEEILTLGTEHQSYASAGDHAYPATAGYYRGMDDYGHATLGYDGHILAPADEHGHDGHGIEGQTQAAEAAPPDGEADALERLDHAA